MHFTNRLSLENFYLIHSCDEYRLRVYLNMTNSDLTKKFTELNRNSVWLKKFTLVIESVKRGISNSTQWNHELQTPDGPVFAIKVDLNRYYTLVKINDGYKELFICRYGKKESQQNTKKLTATIEAVSKIQIQKILS